MGGFTGREIDRFAQRTKRNDVTGCLEWTGVQDPRTKYGMFTVWTGRKRPRNHKPISAHRFAWLMSGRTIPPGYQVMHNCPHGDNPLCCEIEHLLVGSPRDHGIDKAKKGQTRKSKLGLPYGAKVSRHRFIAYPSISGFSSQTRNCGSYTTAEEASAVATFVRNVVLGFIYLGEAPSEKTGWV